MTTLYVWGLVALLANVLSTEHHIMSGQSPHAATELTNGTATGHHEENTNGVLDVAIVGAGPSGAYSAYLLRHSNKSVGVYEYSNRVGGRLFTYKMANTPDVNLELGGMGFYEKTHTRLERLIDELGLHTRHFYRDGFERKHRSYEPVMKPDFKLQHSEANLSEVPPGIRYFLRGRSLTAKEVESGKVPYDLNAEEKANQHRIFEYFLEKLTGYQVDDRPISRDDLLKLRVRDGRLLYQLTFDEALDLVASPDGKEFVRDIHPFTTFVTGNDSAISVFGDHLSTDSFGGDSHTVREGMEAVPRGLIKSFLWSSSKHVLHYNHNLKAIKRRQDNSYALYFQSTKTDLDKTTIEDWKDDKIVYARQVILALPVYALRTIDWEPLQSGRARNAYDAVSNIPANKIYMTFDRPWWQDNKIVKNPAYVTWGDANFSQQMYDWGKSKESGDYIMIASYADNKRALIDLHMRDDGGYVKGSEHGNHKVSPALQDVVLDYLAEAYGAKKSDIPTPMTSMSQFWTDYPFGCGWVSWKAGYHWTDTMDTMRRPSLVDDVYVVGADYAWGLRAQWTEGALETAETVYSLYFEEDDSERKVHASDF